MMTHSTPAQTGTGMAEGPLWRVRALAIIGFLLAVALLMSLAVLLGFYPLIVVAAAVVALILAVPVAWLWRRLSSGARRHGYLVSFGKTAFLLFALICVAIATPVFAISLVPVVRPLAVPQVTLTNGDRTVVFQGMMHVGSEPFYKGVVYDLEEAISQGYVVYFEGVRDSPDGDQWFADTLAGGGDLSATYQLLADICGMHFQLDYFGLLVPGQGDHGDQLIAADVSTADMKNEYDRLMASDPDFAAAMAARESATDTGQESSTGVEPLASWLMEGNARQREIAGTVCKGFLSWQLGRGSSSDPLDAVILEFRNEELADRITADTSQRIYITYGANHLRGLFAALQSRDPGWSVETVKWMPVLVDESDVTGNSAMLPSGG